MSRSMILANASVFDRLADYCADRRVEISEPRGARWIHANPIADETLKRLEVGEKMSFGRHRHLARLVDKEDEYIGLVGFSFEPDDRRYVELDDIQGFDVCLLSEIAVHPTASAVQVRNVVEAGLQGEPGYEGHDNEAVMGLFPSIHILQRTDSSDRAAVWPLFFALCVDESLASGSWIDTTLADSLHSLAELQVPSLPYQDLCRAVLDLDPRSLYMSLYRCIEATYAYETATSLGRSLAVTLPWYEVAARLDSDMGWRPPELQSLNSALAHATDGDLEEICACLDADVGVDLRASAGRAIYRLRNRIVHYRPTTEPLQLETIDWNRACNLLVTISVDVFWNAYGA